MTAKNEAKNHSKCPDKMAIFQLGFQSDKFNGNLRDPGNVKSHPCSLSAQFGRRNITRFLGNVYCAFARTSLLDFFCHPKMPDKTESRQHHYNK